MLDSIHSMYQLETLGASLLLKLLVTDLWTLLWTIMIIEILGAYTICSYVLIVNELATIHLLMIN